MQECRCGTKPEVADVDTGEVMISFKEGGKLKETKPGLK